jgi:hypothetical protein
VRWLELVQLQRPICRTCMCRELAGAVAIWVLLLHISRALYIFVWLEI